MLYPTSATFIDRDQQREVISCVLDKLADNSNRFEVLEFYGLGGSGKSRILDEVKSQFRYRKLPFVAVDFFINDHDSAEVNQLALLLRICDQLDHDFPYISAARALLVSIARTNPRQRGDSNHDEKPTISRQTFDDMLIAFRHQLCAALEHQPLILLFDSVEQCSDDIFDWLGADFLSPLLTVAGVSVVVFLGGRGARVVESRWPLPLKRSTRSFKLDPLAFERTTEHIGHLPPEGLYRAAAKDIFAISNGHPYSTEVVVHHLNRLDVKSSAVGAERHRLARLLYSEVIQQYILADAEDWVLPFIEIACIPRRFEAAILAELLPHFRPAIGDNAPIQWYQTRLVDLQNRPLHLVQLGRGRPAYELEPMLRRLLHTALAILNPDEVIALHRAVRQLWENTLHERATSMTPSASAVIEILYHVAQIAAIEQKEVAQAIKTTLENLLQEHFRPLRAKHLQELNVLRDLLSKDAEIGELLDTNIQRLIECLDRFIQPSPSVEAAFQFTHLIIEHIPPNEYQVSWYRANQIVLPTERIHSARKYSIQDWCNQTDEIGTSAFHYYLPSRAQDFIRIHRDWAIQLSTDWTDIPWELLHDGEEFLCLSRPFARKPKMLKDPKEHLYRREGSLRALVVGNPTGNLRSAETEAKAVAELLDQAGVETDLLLGPTRATAALFSLKIATAHYDLIHYAGHGYFEPTAPHLSGLAFTDGPIFAEELERGLKSHAFVFLNACEATMTATRQSHNGFLGNFIEGLATSVLLGGATGCLGPMWFIEDKMAQEFALIFYELVLAGASIGEAVRQARLTAKQRGSASWLPWILYGDPFYSFQSN